MRPVSSGMPMILIVAGCPIETDAKRLAGISAAISSSPWGTIWNRGSARADAIAPTMADRRITRPATWDCTSTPDPPPG